MSSSLSEEESLQQTMSAESPQTIFLRACERGTELPASKDGAKMSELKLPAPESTKDLVGIFKLLADETRLRILFLLQQTAEINVLELCQKLQQRQPSVSHHLALMRSAGMIEMRRSGKHNYYRLCPNRFREMASCVLTAAPESPLPRLLDQFQTTGGTGGD